MKLCGESLALRDGRDMDWLRLLDVPGGEWIDLAKGKESIRSIALAA